MSLALAKIQNYLRPSRRPYVNATLLALLITSIAWCTVHRPAARPYALEFTIRAFEPVSTQVYFDLGAGLVESSSSSQPIQMGESLVRLPMPAGTYSGLRFDPIDRGGSAHFSEMQIVGPLGAVIRRISLGELQPNDQVAESSVTDGRLRMTSTPTANDPQFTITFDPKLVLELGLIDRLYLGRWWLTFWLGGSFAFVVVVQKTRRNRVHVHALAAWTQRQPRLALAIFAGIAAIASSYPVVFFGKSFLSPNTSHLLYNRLPSVPGYTDAQREDARGADVGAMLWQHYPYTVLQSQALKEGALPLWNRYASGGVTLIGQGQSMFGDPLNVLVVLTGGAPWAIDLKYLLAKALFGCGIGWCVWAMTRDFAASAIITFASVFIAFFNYRINHPSIFTMGYAPWILVAWLHLTASKDRRSFCSSLVLWYAANWTIITSGTVKEAYLLALTLNLTGAAIFFTAATAPWRARLVRGLILALAAIAFILTTRPLWQTFLDALSSAYTAYNAPGLVQVPGERLSGFFDDLFYRPLTAERTVHKPAANFLILLGCLWAVLQPRRLFQARKPLILVVSTVAAMSLAFRFGPFSWPASWILAVPFLRNVFNLDTIFSCVAIIHLCVLAGWGFSAARRPLVAGHEGRYIAIMAVITLAVFIPYFAVPPSYPLLPHEWLGWTGALVDRTVVYGYVIALPLAAWALVLIAGRHLRGGVLNYGTAALAVVALAVLLGRHGQHLRLPTTYVAAPGPRVDLRTSSPAVEFLQQRTRTEPARVQGLERSLFTGFAAIHGFEGINGANALENHYNREFALATGLVTPGQWIYDLPLSKLSSLRPILDFLNVRYLAEPGKVKLPLEGYRLAASLDLNILESEHVWPRAFFTNRIERYNTPADLVRLIQDNADQTPFAALQQTDAALPLSGTTIDRTPDAIAVPAAAYQLKTNSTAFTIEAGGPGIAVLHENWLADDFIATLNGEPVPYFRVNHSFKGVVIPTAGTHRIEFTYSPSGFYGSLPVSAAGFGLILVTLFATRYLKPHDRYGENPIPASA